METCIWAIICIGLQIAVPSKDTTYWCQIFPAPSLTGKHHIVRVDPLIQPGNENLVHHILMYGCSSTVDISYAWFNDECYLTDDSIFFACFSYMIIWSVGQGSFDFPEQVGFPIGPGYTSSFLRLEVHYDNPLMTAGRFDNSGFRLWYTPTLRPTDAGLMEIGLELYEKMYFPEKFDALDAYGYCTRQCLEEGMGSVTNLQVFAAFPHGHLAARKIKMMHIRDGTELKPIVDDEFYDFNFQEIRTLKPEVTIQKGDAITVRCTYETSNRTTATKIGFGTRDEMCFGFLLYYPAINLHRCDSLLKEYESLRYLNEELTVYENGTVVVTDGPFGGMDLKQAVENTNWKSKSRREAFKVATESGDITNYCMGDSFFTHPSHETTMASTPIHTPYVPPPNGC